MQISINKIGFKSYNNAVQNNNKSEVQDFSNSNITSVPLSNYEVGQAILNRNNITFRNLAMPIDVTDKYNKKSNGKNHLDFPNIHVYEYPDTNLQVFINSDDNIKTTTSSVLDVPRYSMLIENNDYKKHDLLKEKLLYFLLNKDNNITNTSFCLNISNLSNTDLLNNIRKINQEVFNKKFDDNDLENAKHKLKAYMKSPEYIKLNKFAKELYSDNDLKSNKEIENEIKDITIDSMQEYYEEYLRMSNIKAFLTISKNFFEQNKDAILKQINPKTNLQFLNGDIGKFNIPKFVDDNTAIKEKATLRIPTKSANTKDSLIENIAINILNSNDDFRKNYSLNTDYFPIPLELKNNSQMKYHCNFCTINIDNNKDFSNFSDVLNKILNKSLILEIENQKNEIKEKLKQTFTDEKLGLIKHLELISYSDDIFRLYEIIDSINEDDIRQYYKNLTSVQKNEVLQNANSKNF